MEGEVKKMQEDVNVEEMTKVSENLRSTTSVTTCLSGPPEETAEADQSAQVSEADQSAQVAETDQSAEVAETDRSAEVAETDRSAEVAETDRSAEVAETYQSAEVAETSLLDNKIDATQLTMESATQLQTETANQVPQTETTTELPIELEIQVPVETVTLNEQTASDQTTVCPPEEDVTSDQESEASDDMKIEEGEASQHSSFKDSIKISSFTERTPITATKSTEAVGRRKGGNLIQMLYFIDLNEDMNNPNAFKTLSEMKLKGKIIEMKSVFNPQKCVNEAKKIGYTNNYCPIVIEIVDRREPKSMEEESVPSTSSTLTPMEQKIKHLIDQEEQHGKEQHLVQGTTNLMIEKTEGLAKKSAAVPLKQESKELTLRPERKEEEAETNILQKVGEQLKKLDTLESPEEMLNKTTVLAEKIDEYTEKISTEIQEAQRGGLTEERVPDVQSESPVVAPATLTKTVYEPEILKKINEKIYGDNGFKSFTAEEMLHLLNKIKSRDPTYLQNVPQLPTEKSTQAGASMQDTKLLNSLYWLNPIESSKSLKPITTEEMLKNNNFIRISVVRDEEDKIVLPEWRPEVFQFIPYFVVKEDQPTSTDKSKPGQKGQPHDDSYKRKHKDKKRR